jgi:transcriptional regulator with XRE-family HTH domain
MRQRVEVSKIRALRESRGWTQEDLAEQSGLSPRSVQRFEQGSRATKESIKRLAAVFQIEPDILQDSHRAQKPFLRVTPLTVLPDIRATLEYYTQNGGELIDVGTDQCAGIKCARAYWLFITDTLLKEHFTAKIVSQLIGSTVPYIYVRQFYPALLAGGAKILEEAKTGWGTIERVAHQGDHLMFFAERLTPLSLSAR